MQSQPLRRVLRCSLAVGVLSSFVCGSDGGTAGIDGGSNSGGLHMTATIDGSAWTASNPAFINAIQATPGGYIITGIQSSATQAITMTISLANIRGPGTY